MPRMSQRCRAQWIEVILICLQKQFQLKDFGAGDGEWGILLHHKTQGHDKIIKVAVTMEKGCQYIRTKRNWQKSHKHTTGNFKTLSFGNSTHMLEVGQFYQPRVSVWKLPAMGALTGGGAVVTGPGSMLVFGFIVDWNQLRSELCTDRAPLHISGEAAWELALYMLKCCHNS